MTERGETIRIMSARAAEPFERRIYHGNMRYTAGRELTPEEDARMRA
jgi:hypothetical protein